jgi:2-phosphoglycerate kinase
MIYLLGGPPRIGKSTVAGLITRQRGISAVSTDSLAAVLESAVGPDAAPDLYSVTRFNSLADAEKIRLMRESPARRVEIQLEESRAVWPAVAAFIESESDERRDVVIEGVAVLPELVQRLSCTDVRAVFVGNQDPQHRENIKRSAQAHPHDWMRSASDSYIDAFATFVAEMSRHIEAEAHRFDLPYLALDRRPFSAAATAVVDALMD